MLLPTCKALHNKGFLEGWPFLHYWRGEGLRDMTFSHDVHLCDWTKQESITVLGGGPGSANFHQVQIPLYSLDGKGSTSGRLGRQGGAGHAIFKLFGKNGCFFPLIFWSHSNGTSPHSAVWMLSTVLLWVRGRGHMLIFSHAATAAALFLKKLCDLERRWMVWMMHGLPRALGVISLFIPPGRKKWVQANDSTPWTE